MTNNESLFNKTRMRNLLVLATLGMFVLGSCESNTPETPDTPDTPDTIPVTGITLNESSVSLMVGDTWQLTAEIQPENADNRTVSWESSDNGTDNRNSCRRGSHHRHSRG